ncbi:hypothetical protein [Pseudomonas gessardii]|uniref:hypothetical protein n=1 Tax=Pseudomonas gessardii TaxID=78544 RepID=UPI000978B1E2|nr:hypothetical protein [Pseudomonas gessardii]MRU51802.1 hypothetical protein [Pseudomonas gessardii]ONH41173.1 hypothetical protein BLL38_15555 [Pseudomonas gessardii]
MRIAEVSEELKPDNIIISGLGSRGIDYFADEWVFIYRIERSVADKPVVFSWPLLLKGFLQSNAHVNGFPDVLKKIAACFLLGRKRSINPTSRWWGFAF